MLLYSENITPRLGYIAAFIGKQINKSSFQLTDSTEALKRYDGVKINYSSERITADELWIRPHTLLFENGIRKQSIDCFVFNNNKAFFKTEGDFPFDVFAASFYLLTRYEEYLPHKKDVYGRYGHENSMAFKENF